MSKRSFLVTLAAALMVCSFGARAATAASVLVHEDEGTFNFVLTADGAGNVTIRYSGELLTKINDVVIPGGSISSLLHGVGDNETISVTSTISTPPLTAYTFSDPDPGNKLFGVGAGATQTAVLKYQVVNGFAVNPGFLNLNANVVQVISPLLETATTTPTVYDFSPFEGGGRMTLTFNKVGADFASVIANGGTVTGTGGFTEQAAPEPGSFALLGIGMAGFLAYRRYFKRPAVA
jgi:hypothetical protein